MEDALVPFVVSLLASCQQVLILVLMEDALVPGTEVTSEVV